jgi:UDP-glucuronate decarboxylase
MRVAAAAYDAPMTDLSAHLSDRHAVVTGGAGFLGSHLCERILAEGGRVTCVDNFITGRPENVEHLIGRDGFRLVKYDVTEFLHVPGEIDFLLHFASPASPIDYLEHPIQTLKVGSLGTHKVLGMAKEKQARILLASTSEVYGDPLVNPQPETYWGNVNPVGPRGVYDEAKRFAEALTLAYHREHGVEVRIARIFNSVMADEQVLYDDGTELRREAVEHLARRLGIGTFAGDIELSGYTVPAFDETGRITAAQASYLVGHPTTQRCFEVRTRYGRSIRVTGDHSLFVEGPDGQPEARPVNDLQVGDRVAIAGRIDVPERDRRAVSMVDVWNRLGIEDWGLLVTAPGLGELVWEHRQELLGPAMRHLGLSRQSTWGKVVGWRDHDELPLHLFRALGLALPAPQEARVRLHGSKRSRTMPLEVAITDELLWLLGLYVAEGCWYEQAPKSAFITISCEEPLLRRAVKVLERDLGLHVVWSDGSTDRAPAIFVHSHALMLLLDHLGLGDGAKRIPGWVLGLPLDRLKWFVEGYREGDGVHSRKKLAAQKRHEFSTTSEALKDDLVVALGRFGIVPSVGRYLTRFRKRTGERTYPFWRITVADVAPWSPLDWDRGVEQTLQARRSGDIVWAAVKEIEEIEPTPLVYDFSVPGRENFYAGGGFLAHNTYGPKMRVNDGRAVPAFFSAALRGEPLPVFGDGQQTRSLVYVDDEVEGLLRLMVSDCTGPVNIGNPHEVTILELAETIMDVVGNHPGIDFQPAPVDDPKVRRPDTTLAEAELGWKATIPLREGLERTVGYFRRELGA